MVRLSSIYILIINSKKSFINSVYMIVTIIIIITLRIFLQLIVKIKKNIRKLIKSEQILTLIYKLSFSFYPSLIVILVTSVKLIFL